MDTSTLSPNQILEKSHSIKLCYVKTFVTSIKLCHILPLIAFSFSLTAASANYLMAPTDDDFSVFESPDSTISDEPHQNSPQESLRPSVFGPASSAPRNDKKKLLKCYVTLDLAGH